MLLNRPKGYAILNIVYLYREQAWKSNLGIICVTAEVYANKFLTSKQTFLTVWEERPAPQMI